MHFFNDVVVIVTFYFQLESQVPVTWWIFPVRLPTVTELPNGVQVLFTGWGSATNTVGLSEEILNKATLLYVSRDACQSYFVDRRIVSSQMCTSANYYYGTCTVSCYG